MMSILNWFTRKQPAKTAAAPDSSGFGQGDATVPLLPPDRLRVKLAATPASPSANRKTERLARRELLYSVVRDAMIRAGVLAANYKFKVLSLDVHGRQYLVMMELANRDAGDSARLAEIEALMAQAAKMRHDLLITAVYWRVNEPVTAGLSQSQPATPSPPPELQTSPSPAAPVSVAGQAPSSYELLQDNEVAAFKRALVSATPVAPRPGLGDIVTSGRRDPAPPVDFEDTQLVEHDERASPLSVTQYGDLN